MKRLAMLLAAALLLGACDKTPKTPPRFFKLSGKGEAIGLEQGPWACVHDRATGLTWEVKSLNENRHYHQATYSWFEAGSGSGVSDGGDCAEDEDIYACDSQDAVDAAREDRLCGRTDWRLPTAAELAGLLNRTAPAGEPPAHNALFPHLQRAPYWTADRRPGRHGLEAAVFHFGDGGTAWLPPSRAARLLLVHGPEPDRRGSRHAGAAAFQARHYPNHKN